MGASCCKAAPEDGPGVVQESFVSSRKEFSRSPLKGHGSDAQFSAESTPRKVQDGSIGAPHDRYDRDTPNSNLGIESKSTTSEARSASSSTCSHDYDRPTAEPLSVSKLSTIHSASLSQPDRSPHSDASPLSHFPAGPSTFITSPRVSPVLSGNPPDVTSANALDSIGDVELPNDVFVRRNSAPADDSDAVCKISPRGPWDDEAGEVTAAFGFDSPRGASGISARNSQPLSISITSDRGGHSGAHRIGAEGGPDLQVHLPHHPEHELLSDAAASRFLAQSHSIMSDGSEYDTVGAAADATNADAALGVEPRAGRRGLQEEFDAARAALEQACATAPTLTATPLETPFVTDAQNGPDGADVRGGPSQAIRRTVSGGVVTGIPAGRGTGRAGGRGRGRGRGGLTARERALHTAPEPFLAGGRVGGQQAGGRTGAGRRGGRTAFGRSQLDAHEDPLGSSTSTAEPRAGRGGGRTGRGRGRGGAALASASQSTSAFSLPGYQGSNSLTDSQMEMQASGFTPTAGPGGQSPAHFFGAQQQFMPGAWGMMGQGSPMMGGGMVMPGSPGMMHGGYSAMSRGGTPSAASPSSVSSQQQRGLSPELAALLGRDGQLGKKGVQMHLSKQQQKMMRHQRRMHSVGSMPMGFGGTPQQMAQLQMAAQQQQMALQMNPMNGQMMMSPQHSRSSSASSFSLNHSLRGMHMRSGSQQSNNHHSLSPHHSASPQHMAMGARHVSMGSSEDSSGGAPAKGNKRGAAQAARPATAGAVIGGAGRGAKRGGPTPGRRGVAFGTGGLNQRSASVAGGLSNAGGMNQPPASAYAQGGAAQGAANMRH